MNAKKKGNKGENDFANWLTKNGIKAYRNSSSGGNTQKSDVHNSINANFEVKTVKNLNLKKAWQQTKRDSEQSHTNPYLAIHFDGMPEESWLIVMDNYDWLEILKTSLEPAQITSPTPLPENREFLWATQNIKVAVGKLERFLKQQSEVTRP